MHPVLAARLRNQHLAKPSLSVAELVASMAAVQAQDYPGAKWALGLRAPGTTETAIQRALDDGAILRTHPMRGTHHFVARDDIRWMLALLAPRGLARAAHRHRALGLDPVTLRAATRALARALDGGNHLTRDEAASALERAGIAPGPERLSHIVMYAELIGLVCSGARRGKQITIALLDERAPPPQRPFDRDAALAELARRYFTTRGPATLRDFVWWSGLTTADARAGVAAASSLVSETRDGAVYWRGPSRPARKAQRAYFLPAYDEYTVAYQRRDVIGAAPPGTTSFGALSLLAPVALLDGVVVATWKRVLAPRSARIELAPWRRLTRDDAAALRQAAKRYAAFIGLPVELSCN